MELSVVLGVATIVCLGLIFGAGTCFWEDIFQKRLQHLSLISRIIERGSLLIAGIVGTLVAPLALINLAYEWKLNLFFSLPMNEALFLYYAICLLLWILTFSIGRRRGGRN